MIIFIVAKNSGLKNCKEIAEGLVSDKSKISFVRGEDVPFLVKRAIDDGKEVLGITGEDLFKEFILETRDNKLEIIKRIPWVDNSALYGKPVLCLLGPKSKNLDELPKKLRVCINKKYIKLSKKFLSRLEYDKGFTFEEIYLSGATEETFQNKIADLVIDIVYSGKSAKEAGLKVYDKIFESDIVVIGKRQEDKFTLEKLYDIISEKIKGDERESYTRKLANDRSLLFRKIIEEAGEVVTAQGKEELIWESADLIYFLLILLAKNSISIKDIEQELGRRNKERLLNKRKFSNSSKGGKK